MDKRFSDWINLKAELHEKNINVPHVNEGDIWWASIGENVGWEVNGKSRNFSRPVIILKKMARGFYFVIPATTQLKVGTWYIHYRHQSVHAVACIHQARAIDHRRLWSKMGRLDDSDFMRIKEGFMKFYT